MRLRNHQKFDKVSAEEGVGCQRYIANDRCFRLIFLNGDKNAASLIDHQPSQVRLAVG